MIKKFLTLFRRREKPKEIPKHQHDFKLMYRTGMPDPGKTEVLKCDCGQWAIRCFGKDKLTMI